MEIALVFSMNKLIAMMSKWTKYRSARMNILMTTQRHNYRIKIAIGLFIAGLALGSSSVPATTISTGEPSITASILNFSFWLQDFNSESADLNFNAYLMDWNTATTPGPVLYESTTQSGSTSPSLKKYTFDIAGGLSITGGDDYVTFISSMDYLAGSSRSAFGSFDFGTDTYSAGNGVVYSGGGIHDGSFSDILSCTTNCWVPLRPYQDIAFEVEYTDTFRIPEPSIMSLLVIGLISIGYRSLSIGYFRRRRPLLIEISEYAEPQESAFNY